MEQKKSESSISRRYFLATAGTIAAGAVAAGMTGVAFAEGSGSQSVSAAMSSGVQASGSVAASASGSVGGSSAAMASGVSGSTSGSASDVAWVDGLPGVPAVWDDEADVIVVGYGGSGSMAAMSAMAQGASVIVLEKGATRAGGNLALSSGVIHDAPGSDVDEWVNCYMHGTLQCGAPEDEIREFLTYASSINEWIGDYGLEITWTDMSYEGTTWPKHYLEGTDDAAAGVAMGGGGFFLFQDIDESAMGRNVDIRLSTPAKKLVQNPVTKEILGVLATDENGKELYFKAKKAVIMSCGGYERNPHMFYDYNMPGIHLIGGGNENSTGDGFPMVMEVGADLWHMNDFHFGGMGFVKPSHEMHAACSPARGVLGGGMGGGQSATPWIIIDCNGKRFMNESYMAAHDMNHKEAFDFSTSSAFHKDITGSFSPQVEVYTDRVSEYVHLPMFLLFDQTFYDANDPLVKLSDSNEGAIDKGWIFKGDTLEDLAAVICGNRPNAMDDVAVNGIDADVLSATVSTYNGYCAQGSDPEFLRDADTLIPLSDQGPYYAIEIQWTMDFTEGGPRRNGKCQTKSVRG